MSNGEALLSEAEDLVIKVLSDDADVVHEMLDPVILSKLDSALELELSSSDMAYAHLLRKDVYMRMGRFDDVEQEIEMATKFDKKLHHPWFYAQAWVDLAKVHNERGQIFNAIKILQSSLEGLHELYSLHESSTAIAHICAELGGTYLEHRKEIDLADEKCYEYLQRAIQSDPEWPDTYLYLGVLYEYEEIELFFNPEKAIECYKRYLDLTWSYENDERRKVAEESLSWLVSNFTTMDGRTLRKDLLQENKKEEKEKPTRVEQLRKRGSLQRQEIASDPSNASTDIRCPICGSETTIRTAKQGSNVGRKFHVCTRYPECKGKIAVE